jgi:hypothetical protein
VCCCIERTSATGNAVRAGTQDYNFPASLLLARRPLSMCAVSLGRCRAASRRLDADAGEAVAVQAYAAAAAALARACPLQTPPQSNPMCWQKTLLMRTGLTSLTVEGGAAARGVAHLAWGGDE